jgi:hypothetical protein
MDVSQFSPHHKSNENHRGKPRFSITLEALPNIDAVKALRAVLKAAARRFGLRCVGISTRDTLQWSNPMNNAELEFLRRYVSAARSHSGFGIPFLKCDGNNGRWPAGKDKTDMTGRRLAADVPDAMHGFQKFENRKPIYVIGRIADRYQPPDRSTLGDTNPDRWINGKDPWASVVLLPMYDPETREPFIFTSSNDGGKDAVTALVDAVVDNVALHPDATNQLPVCELASDSYVNSRGKEIFKPIFEIVGWDERPDAVRRIKPPPIDMLALEHKAAEQEVVEVAPKPKRQRVAAGGSARVDMDDEIPF